MRTMRHFYGMIALLLAAAPAFAECGLKNVIIMIADGWGYNQILVNDYYRGFPAPYESFPVRLGMSTYSYDGWGYDGEQAWADFTYLMERWTDSASAATAMSTGVKIHDGQINVDPVTGEPLFTTLQRAKQLGKAVGVISSVPWSHATPAGWVAHNASRNNYAQIAQEMLTADVDVIMGCGHPWYTDNSNEIIPHPRAGSAYNYVGDSLHWAGLVNGTLGWTLVQDSLSFVNLAANPNPPVKVCGTVKCRTSLQQARSPVEAGNSFTPPYTVPLNRGVPTLTNMANAALNVLHHASNAGLFLMIEGGAVDWANHSNQAGRLIEELTDFNHAVEAVITWVETYSDWNESLLIVTGDHETGYLWGPGSGEPATWNPIADNGPGQMPGGRYYSGSHTNSLIPLYAKGVGSAWFEQWTFHTDPRRGYYVDNTDIARVVFGYYDCTLDVELQSFEAAQTPDGVELRWATASETDNDRFAILRNETPIAEVVSQGNSAAGHRYSWLDITVQPGITYIYTLTAIDINGVRKVLGTYSITMSDLPAAAGTYALHQNYPNPFNAITEIRFDLGQDDSVNLTVFNAAGQQVETLVNGSLRAGAHRLRFDGSRLASGMYIYSLTTEGFTAQKSMLLLK